MWRTMFLPLLAFVATTSADQFAEHCAEQSIGQLSCRTKSFLQSVGEIFPELYQDQIKGDIEKCFEGCPISEEEALPRLMDFLVNGTSFAKDIRKSVLYLKSLAERYGPKSASSSESSSEGSSEGSSEEGEGEGLPKFRRPPMEAVEKGIGMAACTIHQLAANLPEEDPCSSTGLLSEEDGERLIRNELRQMLLHGFDLAEGLRTDKAAMEQAHSDASHKLRTAARFVVCHEYQAPFSYMSRRCRPETSVRRALDFEAMAKGPVLQCLRDVHCRVFASLKVQKEAAKEECAGLLDEECRPLQRLLEQRAKTCVFSHVGKGLSRVAAALQTLVTKLDSSQTYCQAYSDYRKREISVAKYREVYYETKGKRANRLSRDEARPCCRWLADLFVGEPNGLSKEKDLVVKALSTCSRKLNFDNAALASGLKMAKSRLVWSYLTKPLSVVSRDEHEQRLLSNATALLNDHFQHFVQNFDLGKLKESLEQNVCRPYALPDSQPEEPLEPLDLPEEAPTDPAIGF